MPQTRPRLPEEEPAPAPAPQAPAPQPMYLVPAPRATGASVSPAKDLDEFETPGGKFIVNGVLVNHNGRRINEEGKRIHEDGSLLSPEELAWEAQQQL